VVGRKALLVLALVVIVALLVFNIYLGKTKSPSSPISQTVIPPAEASQATSVDSPDGKLTLLMKTVKRRSEVSYSFSVSGGEIFAKTVSPVVSFSIPLNTWSPNGKYVFLKESGSTGVSFFALSASVSSSDQNDRTANITDLFVRKYPDLKITDATGWGGVALIVFNTTKSDGSLGPSFWFEMPSHSFIQLSTHF